MPRGQAPLHRLMQGGVAPLHCLLTCLHHLACRYTEISKVQLLLEGKKMFALVTSSYSWCIYFAAHIYQISLPVGQRWPVGYSFSKTKSTVIALITGSRFWAGDYELI